MGQLADVVRHRRPAPNRELPERHLKKQKQHQGQHEPGGGAPDPVDGAVDAVGESDQRLRELGDDLHPLAMRLDHRGLGAVRIEELFTQA
jgi:hypothetical protein